MRFIVDTSFLMKESLPECLTTHLKPIIEGIIPDQSNIILPKNVVEKELEPLSRTTIKMWMVVQKEGA